MEEDYETKIRKNRFKSAGEEIISFVVSLHITF